MWRCLHIILSPILLSLDSHSRFPQNLQRFLPSWGAVSVGEDVDVALSASLQLRVEEDMAVDVVRGMPPKDREIVSFPLRIRESLVVIVRMRE